MTSQPGLGLSSLNDDIVEYIFNFNTDMSRPTHPARNGNMTHDDFRLTEKETLTEFGSYFVSIVQQTKLSAFTTTLRSSQVCRGWRQLLLGSTAIWGRVIDLDILSKMKQPLREEVFRRAGSSSLLSVRGFRIPYGSPTCDFVFSLIRDHWTRLEWVDLYIQTDTKLSHQQTQFWSTITAPAPNLRHFTFVFSIPITTNPQLLTANAPALRELCTSPSSPLQLNSPWLHQLTFLSVDGVGKPEIPFTLPQFLDVLSHMPNIETLRLVYSRIAEGVYTEYQHVQLPSLRKLILEDDFNTCFSVLRHLSPSSQCTLDICAGNPHTIPNEEYWKLSKSLEKYLNQRTYNDRLLIDLQPKYASFVDAYPDCFPEPTVSIRIQCDPQLDDAYASESFFGNLPYSKFEHVKDLWFRLNPPDLSKILMHSLDMYSDFYYSLESLQVLKTTTQGFMLLSIVSSSLDDDSDDIDVPLPNLQRLQMISNSDSDSFYDLDTKLGPQFVSEFLDLFKWRERRDKAIKHLDVRECYADLRKLDSCKGLKVTWLHAQYRSGSQGEYICGSGNRGILIVSND